MDNKKEAEAFDEFTKRMIIEGRGTVKQILCQKKFFDYLESDKCPIDYKALKNRLGCFGINIVADEDFEPSWGCLSEIEYDKLTDDKSNLKEDIHSGKGVKADDGKSKWSLMPWKQLQKVTDILTFGANKYAPDNWKKVPDAKKRYEDALYRHMTAWSSGEKVDPESGKTHLAHVICNALFLMYFEDEEK